MTYQEVLNELQKKKDLEKAKYRAKKFGINAKNAFGISNADLNVLARQIGKDKNLALALFDCGIYEGKLLCSKILNPKEIEEEWTEKWVSSFDNWEICDSFCMGLVAKSRFALSKITQWSTREGEFEKRAAFATMAAYCMADKTAENRLFLSFLPIISTAINDDRLYVKKAVNWALRSIGKRNKDLNENAIEYANSIGNKNSKSAQWIAKDALRELKSEGVRLSDYPRNIYRI